MTQKDLDEIRERRWSHEWPGGDDLEKEWAFHDRADLLDEVDRLRAENFNLKDVCAQKKE